MTAPSLRVPVWPRLSRELGTLRFPLERNAHLDTDPPFTIAGGRARVTGGRARGVDQAWGSGIPLLARLRAEGTRVATATLTPLGLERDLEVDTTLLVERIAVPRAGPVCFFEWLASGDLQIPVTWRIRAPSGATAAPSHDAPAGPDEGARWSVTERGLVVDARGHRTLYIFSHEPAELVVTPDAVPGKQGGLEVRARLAMSAGEAVRMAAAVILPGDDEARVLRAMDRSHVVVPARRAEATRILDERLAVDATDQALGDALAWSKVRLDGGDGAVGPQPMALSDRDVRLALAALATGDPTSARELTLSPAPQGAESIEDPADAARHLLVTARYLAWTGDLRTVKRAWEGVRRRAGTCLSAVEAGDGDGLVTGALRELVVAAEEAGDEELTRRLRTAVGASGKRVELAQRTASNDPDSAPDPLLRSAALIEAVLNGLLGAEPDAPRGRLVLRPRLPGSWTRFRVRKLAVGDAEVTLAYDRSDSTHRFTLRQERGAAPLRVVLEPELEGRRLVAARVDDESAELDPVVVDGRLRVPVQLVLDHERRLELEILAADA